MGWTTSASRRSNRLRGPMRPSSPRAACPTDRPIVAFVGTLEPRKGVASLVAAFDRVAETQRDAVLVLGGQVGWGLTGD